MNSWLNCSYANIGQVLRNMASVKIFKNQLNSLILVDSFFSTYKTPLIDLAVLLSSLTDDGTGPDKMAHIMGPPDQCQHAASIITDLLQSVRAREEGGQGVGTGCRGRRV